MCALRGGRGHPLPTPLAFDRSNIIPMQATSINVQAVKGGSEQHNKREKPLDYVRSELSHLNEYWESDTQSSRLSQIKERYHENTGQRMQSKATPIREGVVVVHQGTTMEDLKRLGKAYEERFGIKVFQIALHKDEGYMHSKEWKSNLHAHLVFDWTDEKGKTIKLNRADMVAMQSLTAEVLGMDRGVASDKKHLSSLQFKVDAEEKKLTEAQIKLQEADKELGGVENIRERINQALEAQIKPIEELIDANTTKGWLGGSKTNFEAVVEQIKTQEKSKAIVKGAENASKDAKIERLEQELQRANKALESKNNQLKEAVKVIDGLQEAKKLQELLLDDDIVRLVYKSPLKQIEGLEEFTEDIAKYHHYEEFKPLRELTGRIMPSQIFSLWFQRIEMRLGQFVASVSEQGKLLLDGLRPTQLLEKLGLSQKQNQSQDIVKEEMSRGGFRR